MIMDRGSARRSNYIFEYRITVLGSSRVGKTSLIKRFTENEFSEKHEPTIEDHFQHVFDHGGSTCVCLLIDTSGTFEFPAMKNWSISKANAFVVVYSIDDKKSFAMAKLLVDDIKNVKCDGSEIKIVLIGNKMELESKRKVPKEDGVDFAKSVSHGHVTCEFVESSAKENRDVSKAFHSLFDMFLVDQSMDEALLNGSPTEKRSGSFSRTLSLRKSRKNRKSKSHDKNANKQMITRRSDENLLDIEKSYHPRPRAYSLDTDTLVLDSSGSESDSRPSSPEVALDRQEGPEELKPFRRQSSAKELLRRTTSACKEKLDQAKKKLSRNHKLSKDGFPSL